VHFWLGDELSAPAFRLRQRQISDQSSADQNVRVYGRLKRVILAAAPDIGSAGGQHGELREFIW
jgi:hypothetical protein